MSDETEMCKKCFDEITSYFNSEISGYPFIANIDNANVFQSLIGKLQADSSKKIIRISDYCNGDDLPKESPFKSDITSLQNGVVLGFLTYNMFNGKLKDAIRELINLSVLGHIVFLIYGCSSLLKNAIQVDGNRACHRTLIVESNNFSLPKVTFMKSDILGVNSETLKGISALFKVLESFSYAQENSDLIVSTSIPATIFKNSVISIDSINDNYDIICRNYQEIQIGTEKEWGTEKQWGMLSKMLEEQGSLSAIFCKKFTNTTNLSLWIEDVFREPNSDDAWLLWLAMKVLGTKENQYLSFAVKKSISVSDLIELIYMELLCHKHDDSDFKQLYKERKRLIEKLSNNDFVLVQKYCDHVGQFDKDAVYYLTDLTEKEKHAFLYYLGKKEYHYTESEILKVVEYAFPELYNYLGKFEFNDRNTENPTKDSNLLPMLTTYFHDYKLQKITNRIFPNFMDLVDKNAISRPFTKLLARSSIINDIDKKDAQIHFFDALGVEYISYILEKCKLYGLQPLIHIARCELPSITSKNKDFTKFFKLKIDSNAEEIIPGTKELDELKHHSKDIDYQKCKEPIHLFMELEIIDKELKQIRKMLVNDDFKKIIIVSDHGASRLSVIHQSECKMHALEDQGSHSGRCCKASNEPKMEEVIYENGYAVLANYDRFKGSRLANVEVHGGATLEETVVPIIEITLKPENMDIHFVKETIEFHNKEIISVIVYSNIFIQTPKLIIKSISNSSVSFESTCNNRIDDKHYKFDIPEIKRSGNFIADLYDDHLPIQQGMKFETKNAGVKEKDLFS